MKRVTATWIDPNSEAETPTTLAANSTPVGHVLAGHDIPQKPDDILLVQFYLHRLGVMTAGRPRGSYAAGYAALRFSPSELIDISNSAALQRRIKLFQSAVRGNVVDGRVSVMPGSRVEGWYRDRSGYGGQRRYTIGWLILEWQFFTESSKSDKLLSLQPECPARLKSALAAV